MENRESEDGNSGLSERHQLLCNSLGFERILCYISNLDKASVRLVCKQWEKSSRAKWRRDSTLQIIGVPVVHTCDENNTSKRLLAKRLTGLTIKQILEQVLHVNVNLPSDHLDMCKYPFRKLKISGDLRSGIGIMDDIETNFWNIFGANLRHLHLNGVALTMADGATQLHRILCELTPNLKEFVYTQTRVSTLHDPVVRERIQKIQPNLTSITINLFSVDYWNIFCSMIESKVENIIITNNGRPEQIFRQLRQFVMPSVSIMDPDFEDNIMLVHFALSKHMDHDAITSYMRIELEREPQGNDIAPVEPECNVFPFDWKLIFETFPNLKKIAHDFIQVPQEVRYAFYLVFKTLLLHLISVIKQVRRERPNTLNIDSWNGIMFGGHVITQFCELSLPIRSFAGKFERTSESEFRRFLTCHQNTLKELIITNVDDTNGFNDVKDMWLPAGLTYLQLNCPWGNCLDFLTHVPNLETLIFSNALYQNKETIGFSLSFGERRAVQPLEQMKEFQCKMVLDEDGFNKILNLMPNLTKLTIGMDYKRWMIAGWGWTELEHLTIPQRHWNENFFLDEESFVRFADRLQKLKTFVVEEPWSPIVPQEPTHFGDLSIYEGFLKMPQLQSLTIKFSSAVTERAIAALKKKIPHVDI